MDIVGVERGILVRVDGAGTITIQHDGLTPVECMGLLAMAQVHIMDDLQLRDKTARDAALLDKLKRLRT